MSPIPVQQRTAVAAATLVLFGAVAGLILDAQDDEASVALASPTPAATSSGPPTPKPAGAVTAKPAAPTTAPAPTSAPAPTAQAGSVTPPKPGRYVYKVNSQGDSANEQFEIAGRGGGNQSEEQDGVRADVAWTATEKIIDRIIFGPLNCDWIPNLQELKFPLTSGKSWDIIGHCTTPEGLKMSFKGSTRVEGMHKRSVGGTSVDTWLLKNDVVIRASGGGESFEQHITQDAYLSPVYGLYVYSVDRSEGTDPATGEEGTTDSTSELLSLTPG